jgi:hypothetical protein
MSEQEKNQPVSYETVRPFLKASLEQILVAGRGVRDMVEFSLDRLGDTALPYVNRFLSEVHAGQVKINGLTASVQQSLFDGRPSPEERERLIQEAAYLRAEKRGFVDGSPEEDWAEAEREVDARLAEADGLIALGRHAVESAAAAAEPGAEATYALVEQWLAGRDHAVEKEAPRLAHTPEAAPEAPPEPPAEKLKPIDSADAETVKPRTRRVSPRAKQEGESTAVATATAIRTRRARSPGKPRAT